MTRATTHDPAPGDDPAVELKDRLIATMIPQVVFDGWSRAALLAAARDRGVAPELALDLFPRGAADMAAHYSALADRRMLDKLDAQALAAMPAPDRVAAIIKTRFEQCAPEREAVRRALAALAAPGRAAMATRCVWRTVDAIWRAAGDRASDFNHYTKRASLSAIYGAALLYWLNDDSPDSADTWAFLDRRLAGVKRRRSHIQGMRGRLSAAPGPLLFARAVRRGAQARAGRRLRP